MSEPYYVDVDFSLSEKLSKEREFDLLDQMGSFAPAASIARNRKAGGVSLTVSQADMAAAVEQMTDVLATLRKVLGDMTVTKMTVMDERTRKRENEATTFPELIMLVDIGKLIGVTRQRARQLSQKPTFPKPIIESSAGPFFAKADVLRWLDSWSRTTGRPSQ